MKSVQCAWLLLTISSADYAYYESLTLTYDCKVIEVLFALFT